MPFIAGFLRQEREDGGPTCLPSVITSQADVTSLTYDHFEQLSRALEVVDQILSIITAPAVIVDSEGAVLQANDNARRAIARDGAAIRQSLLEAVRSQGSCAEWDLHPMEAAKLPRRMVAVLKGELPGSLDRGHAHVARLRWHLTERQTDVLRLVARGLTNRTIAESLEVTTGTVEYHLAAIFDKAGVSNRATLIASLRDLG